MKYPDFDGSQACAQIGSEFFYPPQENPQGIHRRRLKEICGSCNFQDPCLEYALAHEQDGWWGGTSSGERRAIRRARGLRLERVLVVNFLPQAAS